MAEKGWANLSLRDLSDQQKNFLKEVLDNSTSTHFLTGCAGSGKTLMAVYAAQMLKEEAEEKNESYSIRTTVFTKLLSKFIADGAGSVIPGELTEVGHFHQRPPEHVNMEIVDEFQDFESAWIKKVEQYSDARIWLGDPSQQIYQDALDDGGADSLYNKYKGSSTHLQINYRNSINVAQLAKYFITLNDHDREKGITLKEKINNFIKPIYSNDLQSSEANNHTNIFIEADNEEQEYDAIAKIIKNILNEEYDRDRKKHIIIPQLHNADVNKVNDALKARGIDSHRAFTRKGYEDLPDFSKDNLVMTCTMHSLKGLECDYLIFPRSEEYKVAFNEDKFDREILDNLLHVLFTRAKKRVWCSYVDPNESIIHKTVSNSSLDNESDKWNDFIQRVPAKDILGDQVRVESPDEIKEKVSKSEDRLAEFFASFDDDEEIE